MLNQRQYIYDNNADHSLDNILDTTNRHIRMLSAILPNTTNPNHLQTTRHLSSVTEPIAYPQYRPYINNGSTPPNTQPNNSANNQPNNTQPNNQPNNTQPNTDNTTIPPLAPDNRPSTPQADQPNNNGNTPNNNSNSSNNQPNPNTNNGATPPTTQPNRTTRNSPLQSGILSNIARAIFGRKIRTNTIVANNYRNRFHNSTISQPSSTLISNPTEPSTKIQHSPCQPHRKMITNECNILRLILLYIALHPHCPHNPTLSTIAEERVRLLTDIM